VGRAARQAADKAYLAAMGKYAVTNNRFNGGMLQVRMKIRRRGDQEHGVVEDKGVAVKLLFWAFDTNQTLA
jgi:hypothetical protein